LSIEAETFAATWRLAATACPSALRAMVPDVFEATPPPPEVASQFESAAPLGIDKLFVLRVARYGAGYRITAREWDASIRQWGAPRARDTPAAARSVTQALRTLATAFAPVARLVEVTDSQVILRLRGSALGAGEAAAGAAARHAFFVAAVAADGEAPESIPWTWLRLDEVEADGRARCSVVSRYEAPLASLSGGLRRWLALGAARTDRATRLRLVHSGEAPVALAGFEVVDLDAGGASLGFTAADGSFLIRDEGSPLRRLEVRAGSWPVTRLPLVPGFVAEIEAEIPWDESAIDAHSAWENLRSELLDLVALRESAAAAVEESLNASDAAGARARLDALKALPDAERYLNRIASERRRFFFDDPVLEKQVEFAFAALTELAQEKLAADRTAQLESRLERTP
jgi:hypothetical protein